MKQFNSFMVSFLAFGLLCILLTGCGQFSVDLVPQPETGNPDQTAQTQFEIQPAEPVTFAAEENSPNATPEPAPTVDPSYLEKIVSYTSQENQWNIYNNTAYGFAFQYPAHWSLIEVPGENRNGFEIANALDLTYGTYHIKVWFKRAEEDKRFPETVSSGDHIEHPSALFMGNEIQVIGILQNQLETAILYGADHWINTSRLSFSFNLVNTQPGQTGGNLINTTILAEAQQIMGSFAAAGVDHQPAVITTTTASQPCDTAGSTDLQLFTCNIIDSIRSKNTSALLGFTADPFPLGYWGSEGVMYAPEEFATALNTTFLPADSSGLTFTENRESFPPLAGMPPEAFFGPDLNVVKVIYSEGWGQDGLGAAILLIAQTQSSEYYLAGAVYSFQHFDK